MRKRLLLDNATKRHVIEIDSNINGIAHRESVRLGLTMREYFSLIITEHICSVAKVNSKGELV